MELQEQTIDSKEVFAGRLVKLRVDTVRLPNGRETTREVVVHRGAVAAVPLLNADTVVMVRQFRQAVGETLLEIPAGTLDPGEDPVACVVRELEEEIGFHANRVTAMFRSYLAPGYSSEMLHTFLAEDLVKARRHTEEDEFIEIVQIPLDEAVGLILSGEIKDAKSVCGILMAQRVLASRKADIRAGQ
ncbi:MAG: NUDIX domain-containing protein [Armatimonadota bacterium]